MPERAIVAIVGAVDADRALELARAAYADWPAAPGAVPLDASTYRLPVLSGQGLRLQIVNCATTRYFPSGDSAAELGWDGTLIDVRMELSASDITSIRFAV